MQKNLHFSRNVTVQERHIFAYLGLCSILVLFEKAEMSEDGAFLNSYLFFQWLLAKLSLNYFWNNFADGEREPGCHRAGGKKKIFFAEFYFNRVYF